MVDLGAAPGSWSHYASEKVRPGGKVIAVDLLDMQPLANVTFLQGDITDPEYLQTCINKLQKYKVDLVISDMAPNLSGITAADQANSLRLAETACGAGLFSTGQERPLSWSSFSRVATVTPSERDC